MSLTLREIADLIGGELHGDHHLVVQGASTLRDARSHEISLADRPQLAEQVSRSAACAVVVTKAFQPDDKPFIVVGNVHEAFGKIVAHFRPPRTSHTVGVSPAAYVSSTAKLGPQVVVHPMATVGDDVEIGEGTVIHSGVHVMAGCRIGKQVTIFPNAVLYEDTVVGDRSIIHANSVIGAYGFGYETVGGRHRLSAQLGRVELGCDVEIGSCTTIDRGTYDVTQIGDGTKIDNQVQVAHNCRIGKHNILCSQVGIAGSSTTGDYVVMAGQVGVRDHVHIGTQAKVGAKSGVMANIPDGAVYLGVPAMPERENRYLVANLIKLPEMRKQLREMQHQLDELASAVMQDAA